MEGDTTYSLVQGMSDGKRVAREKEKLPRVSHVSQWRSLCIYPIRLLPRQFLLILLPARFPMQPTKYTKVLTTGAIHGHDVLVPRF